MLLFLMSVLTGSFLSKGQISLEASSNVVIKNEGIMDYEAAEKYAESRAKILIDLLKPKFDPYTGEQPLSEKCQKKNLPPVFGKRDSSGFYKAISLYSSKNKILGVCNPSAGVLKTQYLIIYCTKARKLFFIKKFYDDSLEWIKVPVASCEDLGER